MAKQKKRNYQISIVKTEDFLGKVHAVFKHKIVLHIEGEVSEFDVAFPVETIGNGSEFETIEEMIAFMVHRVERLGFKCIRNEEELISQFLKIHSSITEEQYDALKKWKKEYEANRDGE